MSRQLTRKELKEILVEMSGMRDSAVLEDSNHEPEGDLDKERNPEEDLEGAVINAVANAKELDINTIVDIMLNSLSNEVYTSFGVEAVLQAVGKWSNKQDDILRGARRRRR